MQYLSVKTLGYAHVILASMLNACKSACDWLIKTTGREEVGEV